MQYCATFLVYTGRASPFPCCKIPRMHRTMDYLSALGPPDLWLFAYAIALCAGVVKGVVGFAMPLILLSGLSTFVAPDIALACLIVPTLMTNTWQALRQGGAAAVASVVRFRVFLIAGGLLGFFG